MVPEAAAEITGVGVGGYAWHGSGFEVVDLLCTRSGVRDQGRGGGPGGGGARGVG